MTLREVLVPALKAAFPGRELRVSNPPDPVIAFPAVCLEVGEVQIYDDGDEATVWIERITHYHVNPYDENMTDNERYRWITDHLIESLTALFADQMLLWSVDEGKRGGCLWPFDGTIPPDTPKNADTFVWSRRIR